MNRRRFLHHTAASAIALALPRIGAATDVHQPARFEPQAGDWRVFELTTRVQLQSTAGTHRVWLPLPSVYEDAWIRPIGNTWSGNATVIRPLTEPRSATQMLFAEWGDAEATPVLEAVSRFAVRDRSTDWRRRGNHRLPEAQRRLYTKATRLVPTDGIVLRTANEAAGGARRDVDRARAIYEWIVDNSARNPKTRGCGLGDIATMLETGDLTGKCADINTLFVGMCRALGIPARDVYGVRIADSRFGYRSLGKSGDVSKAQHCRAEVFLQDYGWVPADPADVRKVVLEERAGLTLSDPLVSRVRKQLFGAWETNWLAYNFAHDLQLPFSDGPDIPFLMYPQGEVAGERLDSLDPDGFSYTLTAAGIGV